MRKLQSQGVHHITLVGADRQTSIDFWEGVLGMPFIFEQPTHRALLNAELVRDLGVGEIERRRKRGVAQNPEPALG